MEQFFYESGKEMMLKLLEEYLLLFPLQITEKDGFSPWKWTAFYQSCAQEPFVSVFRDYENFLQFSIKFDTVV